MPGNGPTTPIEIQSNAALLLGKKPFTTIDDSDQFALSIQKFYDMLVPSELGSGAWKFAKKHVQLGQIAGFDPDFAEYNTAYALPGDMLNVVRVYPPVWYQIFENRLYTGSTGELSMEYTYNAPVTSWLPNFKTFMSATIALNQAMAVAENDRLIEKLAALRREERGKAMFTDGQNSPNRQIQSSPWTECRAARFNRPSIVGSR